MKIIKTGPLSLTMLIMLSACSTQASRMADCQQQGVSKDTCYLAEQQRQTAIIAAAENQAMENARQPVQHAQAAHNTAFVKHVGEVEIKRDKLGIVTVDGHPAALTEKNANASSYQSGLYDVIIYKSGKVALMKGAQFVDFAR